MRLGFHISIAGGFSKVIGRAKKRGCETIQFFSRNPRGWAYGCLSETEVNRFRLSLHSSDFHPVFVHMPYLANIANPESPFYARSIESLATELKRAEQLGAHYVIIHIGHRGDASEEQAIGAIAHGIDQAFCAVTNDIRLLLENTAGQGTEVGSRFEEISNILERVGENQRMGVCLDTAHAFAAGYDLSSREGIERTLESFERSVGLKRIHLLHLNDSKASCGSKKDRHWHIGEGHIGLEGFRYLINHPRLRHLPGIMETPRKDTVEDLRNMKVMRSLVQQE